MWPCVGSCMHARWQAVQGPCQKPHTTSAAQHAHPDTTEAQQSEDPTEFPKQTHTLSAALNRGVNTPALAPMTACTPGTSSTAASADVAAQRTEGTTLRVWGATKFAISPACSSRAVRRQAAAGTDAVQACVGTGGTRVQAGGWVGWMVCSAASGLVGGWWCDHGSMHRDGLTQRSTECSTGQTGQFAMSDQNCILYCVV